MRLGIDFGTTRTVVAAALDGRYPVASFDVGGSFRDYVPGLVARTASGLVYGWDAAAAEAEGRASLLVRSIKRAVTGLGPDMPVAALGPDAPDALTVVSGFLAHVRRLLLEHANLDLAPDEPLEPTIAVPANASSRQRYLTIEAFRSAGFAPVRLLNEPTAAAIEFAHRNTKVLSPRSPKRYVVVYDLGGGTFDTSAVSLEGRRFELLASEGIGRCGGDDFDALIAELALDSAGGPALAALPPEEAARLLERCREAKEGLRPTSRKLMVEHVPAAAASAEQVVIETAALYARAEPLVEQTIELIERVFSRLAGRGIDPDDTRALGGLYLVGGSVAFPAVTRALRALYKHKLQLAPEPHAATAVGLAISCDPGAAIAVHEATTRHFGVWREAEEGREKIFDAILGKDVLPPGGADLVIERVYRPAHRIGRLRFLECTALGPGGQPEGDLTPWTEVVFPYDPTLADERDLASRPVERCAVSDAEIAETYTYDRAGRVAVRIANRTAGIEREYVLGTLR